MPDKKELINEAFNWTDPVMWSVIGMFVAGTLGRILVSDEPFDSRRFTGEIILSIIGAIILYSFNVMQGMSPIQIIFFGALGSMGGIRLIEWLIKIAKKIQKAGIL